MTDGSLDGFVDALSRHVDVTDVETIYPAGEDMPGIEQGEVKFHSTAARSDEISESYVEYRGLSDEAGDLRLYLGTVPEDAYDREELKSKMESIVSRNVPYPDSDSRGAGVVIADGMVSGILQGLGGGLPMGSGLERKFDGVGVTVVNTGMWSVEDMVAFIESVQSGFLSEVLVDG